MHLAAALHEPVHVLVQNPSQHLTTLPGIV